MKKIVYPAIGPYTHTPTSWTEELCRRMEAEFQASQQAWEAARFDDSAIRFPGYTHIYKYRAVDLKNPDRTKKIFADRTIWTASLDRFNDPMEAAFVVTADLPDNETANVLSSMAHGNWWGCVSFSSDPACVQMWAHYAADHSGICVQYKRADSILLSTGNCQPMAYQHWTPEIYKLDDTIHQIFWAKSDAWEYEREWRLMYPRANAYVGSGLLIPSGVIFGLRSTDEVKNLLREWAPYVRFGQIVPAKTDYRLQIHWEGQDGE